MKKINLIVFALLLMAGTGFAQAKKAPWPEMKAFHSYLSSTFHPAEEGDLNPLKLKADSLYYAAKTWYAAKIPAGFIPEITESTLKALMIQCNDIWAAVKDGASDAKLKDMITKAHDIFHEVAEKCRKAD